MIGMHCNNNGLHWNNTVVHWNNNGVDMIENRSLANCFGTHKIVQQIN